MKEGVIIGSNNPQREIQRHSETADWEFKEQAAFMYKVGQEMMRRFFNGLVYLDGRTVPDPLIAFDNLRNNDTLAQYDLRPDEYGLMYKITHNTAHFEDKEGKKVYRYGTWAWCEVQLHEMLHVWQQHGRGNDPYKHGLNTHNKEFCLKAKELGLNVFPVLGCHYQVADEGSPFAILMHELGIARPTDVPRSDKKPKDDWFEIGKKRKGESTLHKYSCGCQNAWIGAKEFFAICIKCGNPFLPIETKATAVLGMTEGEGSRSLPDKEDRSPKKATKSPEKGDTQLAPSTLTDKVVKPREISEEESEAIDHEQDVREEWPLTHPTEPFPGPYQPDYGDLYDYDPSG